MIYLDYNSTTPVDKRVLEAMLPYFTEKFGNASSKSHAAGWVAEAAVELAREKVAKSIGATPHEIIFTSGATEAINLALKGVFEYYSGQKNHIITVATEHKAVLDTCKYLESKGAQITYLPVDRDGLIDLNLLSKSITEKTILVCVMYANNETGVIQPISEIAKIAHDKKCLFMSDATQAVGKTNSTVTSMNEDVINDEPDLICFSAHKLYGPKGVGALFVRRKNPRVNLLPLIHGGSHENGFRSGTLNVPAIVGFGKACEIAQMELWDEAQRLSRLRTFLEQSLQDIGNVFVNGSIKNRICNTTNISFQGIKADALIKKLHSIALAMGSACSSAISEPSHVLKAMGLSNEMSFSSIRFSLGRFTTESEIQEVILKVKNAIYEIRQS